MPLYFAYGSNMNPAAMARRCPASKPIGSARLLRHRFFISMDGYASIVRDPHRTVWGVLWDLSLADVPALDRYEEVPAGLYTKVIQPVLASHGPRRAMIYIGRTVQAGRPRGGYMDDVVAAAGLMDLPASYIRELETWLPTGHKTAPEVASPRSKVRPLWNAPATTLPRRPPR